MYKIRTLEKGTGVRRTASLTPARIGAYTVYVYFCHTHPRTLALMWMLGLECGVSDWERFTSEILASGKTEKLAFFFMLDLSVNMLNVTSAFRFWASGSADAQAKGVIEKKLRWPSTAIL